MLVSELRAPHGVKRAVLSQSTPNTTLHCIVYFISISALLFFLSFPHFFLPSFPSSLPVRSCPITALFALGIGGAAGAIRYQTDEGTRRSVYFWSRAFPIYLHYRYVSGVQGSLAIFHGKSSVRK